LYSLKLRLLKVEHDSTNDEKHQYEGEAEESDADFIDDDDPDESNSDAIMMTKSTRASLRNRKKWQEAQVRPDCALCADLKVVLGHLLGLENIHPLHWE
jgi:hypothetical protein